MQTGNFVMRHCCDCGRSFAAARKGHSPRCPECRVVRQKAMIAMWMKKSSGRHLREEAAARRAAFLADRDAAYAAVAAPVTRCVSQGRVVECRGRMLLGSWSKPGKNTY